MTRILIGGAVLAWFLLLQGATRAQQPAPAPNPGAGAGAGTLAPEARRWLASGVALYPDAVLEKVLEAAQTPDAVVAAAGGQTAGLPAGVADLAREQPDTLKALAARPGLTARLGQEFRANPSGVWSDVESVRSQMAAAQAQAPPGTPAEDVSYGASQALATPGALNALAADAAATAPPPAATGYAPSTVVVPGGTTVVPAAPYAAYPATGYPGGYAAAGFYVDDAGGAVRRGAYGHGAVDANVNDLNRDVTNADRRADGAANRDGAIGRRDGQRRETAQGGAATNRSGRYAGKDQGQVASADRSLSRNWGAHGGGSTRQAAGGRGESGGRAESGGRGESKGGRGEAGGRAESKGGRGESKGGGRGGRR